LAGPENAISAVGSNVTLRCSSPSRNCDGTEWLKYGASGNLGIISNDRGVISNTYGDRYRVDNSSGCDLVIKNVEYTDAGRFICRAFISSQTVEKSAYLVILGKLLLFQISSDYVVIRIQEQPFKTESIFV